MKNKITVGINLNPRNIKIETIERKDRTKFIYIYCLRCNNLIGTLVSINKNAEKI